MENWKDIPKFEGVYQISNMGNLKRLAYDRHLGRGIYKRVEDRLRNLTLNKSKNCVSVSLTDGDFKKAFVVSRLVYQIFNEVKLQRNHIILLKDGNPLNCKIDNLKLITKRNFVAAKMKNISGYTGVTRADAYGQHTAKIEFESIKITLHVSKDIDVCNKIYQAAKKCFEDYDRIKTSILSNESSNRLINKSTKL